jgi:hypothetical protein
MAEFVSSISTSSALRAVELMCKQWLNDAVHACLAQPCVPLLRLNLPALQHHHAPQRN